MPSLFSNLHEISGKRVFHFSGGRSSALMVLQCYQPGDLVLFCDTGREHPETYRFINDFERENNIPVIRLTGNWAKEVTRNGKQIPNMFKRICTIKMKIKKARRYLRSIGWFRYTQFIGFRADEKKRVKDYETWQQVETVFPLFDAGITKQQVYDFWQPIPYRLQIPQILSNCDLCFLKGEQAVIAIIQDEPTRADKWISDEQSSPAGYTYFPKISMFELRAIALTSKKIPLEDLTFKQSCTCHA